MKQHTSEVLGHGTTGLAVSSGASSYFGWFQFINDNAAGIGVLLSFVFGTIGAIFYFLTWRKSIQADQNKKDLEMLSTALDEHKEETKEEFKSVNDGISEILSIVQDK